ncbi:hypothetical protein AVO42_03145 [Thiomicrospira sp. XS5]|uniref:hypothetical protein n=1 Tax=Thiomicrospira sp. XS5 TaxID=1775636 RepID=UPI0007476C50|nr:hypothetical protein [Thiomicrospira sp. XS5]KUJ74417.1 hypothetical protein AVO42_03145 [Thiomicrospira sp. XS5]
MPPHHNDIEPKLSALKARLESYAPISEATWQRLRALCTTRTLAKGAREVEIIQENAAHRYQKRVRRWV